MGQPVLKSWPKRHIQTRILGFGCSILLLAVACRQASPARQIDEVAQQYVQLVVALGERDPDSIDFYSGPEADVAEIRRKPPSEAAIAEQAGALSKKLQAMSLDNLSESSVQRSRFLRSQLDALRMRAAMLSGAVPSFEAEASTLFGVGQASDIFASQRAQNKKEVAGLLGGGKDSAHSYTEYERRFVVQPEKVPTVMQSALQECRAATLAHVRLPESEKVAVQYVFHKPWSGFSRYLGHGSSLIQINMDFPLTVAQILNLACHEGYPGHHVFNSLRDEALVQGRREQEWSVQPTFSPQSFVSESAATFAPEIAFTPEQQLHVIRDVLFPLAGIDKAEAEKYVRVEALIGSLDTGEPAIAREFLDGRLEFVRAADALQRETLMEHPEPLLLYFNEYRSYMLSYTVGRRMVERRVDRDRPSPEVRWQRYIALMTAPIDSLNEP